ncbi:MAG: radical SAM protein [Bacteroidaceae bacterium]|nr:radical SAM protein [Bacteroidaceae bacterium]
MSTVLYSSPIFGPIHSRRLGVSLGINLLPADGKVCSFDCIYCECGFNKNHRTKSDFPTREEVYEALEKRLQEMKSNGPTPTVLTFAGNGEPTCHPMFAEIIHDTMLLRDNYFPEAKVCVLSNASFINRPKVFEALKKVDDNILKLDTIDRSYIQMLDRPSNDYDVDQLLERLAAFNGDVIIQTMFLKGSHKNVSVDNTTDKYVLPWLDAIKKIAPQQVMIYTIDRETPELNLEKALPIELDRIAKLLSDQNISVSVSY